MDRVNIRSLKFAVRTVMLDANRFPGSANRNVQQASLNFCRTQGISYSLSNDAMVFPLHAGYQSLADQEQPARL